MSAFAISDVTSFFADRPILTASVLATCAGVAGLWLYRRRQRSSSRNVAVVTGLCIYPVKSCQGISVTTAHCEARGFRYDRRFVVIDRGSKDIPAGTVGVGLSMKKVPKLAQIKPSIEVNDNDGSFVLRLNAPNMSEFVVRAPRESATNDQVSVRHMQGEGADCGDAVAAWLSEVIGLPDVRLYYMSNNMKARKVADDLKWGNLADEHKELAFASFSPYHLVNEKSLADLNSRMPGEGVGSRPFRANIIVDSHGGQGAYSEDSWMNFTIGAVPFRFMRKCDRCEVTTQDQETGRRRGPEPMKSLREYRVDTSDERFGTKPCFGVNLESVGEGTISVGDEVVLC